MIDREEIETVIFDQQRMLGLGKTQVRNRVINALEDIWASKRHEVLIAGDPGSGKTLLVELAVVLRMYEALKAGSSIQAYYKLKPEAFVTYLFVGPKAHNVIEDIHMLVQGSEFLSSKLRITDQRRGAYTYNDRIFLTGMMSGASDLTEAAVVGQDVVLAAFDTLGYESLAKYDSIRRKQRINGMIGGLGLIRVDNDPPLRIDLSNT